MKIANLMFGGKRGGVEQAAVDYCIALKSMGHDVTAIVRENTAVIPLLEDGGVPMIPVAMPYPWNPAVLARLEKLLRDYDLIVLHGNRAGTLTRDLKNLPAVVAVAHSRFFTPQPHFDAIIALSAQRAEVLATKAGCPIYVVPNMIDMPNAAARVPMRTPPVIGAMGRFSPEKGFDLFIDALALLRERHGDVRAVIGGVGVLEPKLQRQAKLRGVADAIEWCGWVNDRTRFFSDIDIFCMASRTETFPITLLEAMAHGCPVVATDCGGPSAILTENTGILTPVTAVGIAEGLSRALAAPQATEAMGRAGRAHAAALYATPVVARKLHDTLVAIAAQPKPVLNVMLGKLRGGLEQAAVDYAEALHYGAIPSITVVSPNAYITPLLGAVNAPHVKLRHFGWWDLFASRRLRRIAEKRHARAIICHGNRALTIARRAVRTGIPVIAVAHNYRLIRFPKADASFCITHQVMDELEHMHIPRQRLFFMPNMVRVGAAPARDTPHRPPVIGTMGRFVARKGFDLFLDALAILQSEGVDFQATLGGSGPEYNRLRQHLILKGLESRVTMPGWIENKQSWFENLDLFVMPSHHEPFGIVLIEAMAAGLPVIASASIGPSEIIRDGKDGLLCPLGDAQALAASMRRLLENPKEARALANAGYARVADHYSIHAMAGRLRGALDTILTGI